MGVWIRTLPRVALIALGLVLLVLCLSGSAWAKGYVFITYQDGTMYRIDAANYSLLDSFSISNNKYMAASPDGGSLYLAGNNNITVFNTTSFTRGTSIPYTDPHESVCDVIMGGDGRLYVAMGSRYIYAYDVNAGRQISGAAVFIAANPYRLELSPEKGRLYVAACMRSDGYYWNDYNLSVYDVSTNRLNHVVTRRLNMAVEGIAASPDGNSLYVVGHNSSTGSKNTKVLKLRASDLSTERTGSGSRGLWPADIAVSPDGGRLYVTENDNDTVLVYNADTLALVRAVAVGDTPRFMDLSANGKKLYITNNSGGFAVMDTDTCGVTRTEMESHGVPIDIEYVNVGPEFLQFYAFNLSTPTPRPTIQGYAFNATSASPSPSPAPAASAPGPTSTGPTDEPLPSPEASATMPLESGSASSPEASPGVSSTASTNPAGTSIPGFAGLVTVMGITLVAGALSWPGQNKKKQ